MNEIMELYSVGTHVGLSIDPERKLPGPAAIVPGVITAVMIRRDGVTYEVAYWTGTGERQSAMVTENEFAAHCDAKPMNGQQAKGGGMKPLRIPKNIRDLAKGGSLSRPDSGIVAGPPVDLALLVAAVRQAGYPEPVPEFEFTPARKWRFDLAWPPLLVAFEREGGTWVNVRCQCGKQRTIFKSRHHDRDGLERDAEKYSVAAACGWAVIRGTPGMLKNGKALHALLFALEVRTRSKNAA